jgi:phosphoribosylformylglycinamidine synthase
LLGEIVDANDPILGLGGSAYLQVIHGKKTGSPPRCDLETAKTLHTTLLGLIQSGLVKSAHDCSDGGLAVALAESCISQLIARETPRLIGATIDLTNVGQASRLPSERETPALLCASTPCSSAKRNRASSSVAKRSMP